MISSLSESSIYAGLGQQQNAGQRLVDSVVRAKLIAGYSSEEYVVTVSDSV